MASHLVDRDDIHITKTLNTALRQTQRAIGMLKPPSTRAGCSLVARDLSLMLRLLAYSTN